MRRSWSVALGVIATLAASTSTVSADAPRAPATPVSTSPSTGTAASIPPALERSLPEWFDDALLERLVTAVQSSDTAGGAPDTARETLAGARNAWRACRLEAITRRLALDDGQRCAAIVHGERDAESVADVPTILATCRTVAGIDLDARRCDDDLLERIESLLHDFGVEAQSIQSVLRLMRRSRAAAMEAPMGDLRAFVDLFTLAETMRRCDTDSAGMLAAFAPTRASSTSHADGGLAEIAQDHERRMDDLLRRRDERQRFTLALLAGAPTLDQLDDIRRAAIRERREHDHESIAAARDTARRIAQRLEENRTPAGARLAVEFRRRTHWAMAPRLLGPTPIDALASELRIAGTGDRDLDAAIDTVLDRFAIQAELLEARVIDCAMRGVTGADPRALGPDTNAWRAVAELQRLCRACNDEIAAIAPASIAGRLAEANRRHRTTTVADLLPRPTLP